VLLIKPTKCETAGNLPQGICVAILTNLEHASVVELALQIADEFIQLV
jgi:hypothetical protein